MIRTVSEEPRGPKGGGSVYLDGNIWKASVSIDGKRKVVRATSELDAHNKRRELLNRKDAGTLTAGSSSTVEAWVTHWFENIATLSPMSRVGYGNKIRAYIMPSLGTIRLDKLAPEHLERLYASMLDGSHKGVKDAGVGASTIKQVHSILRRSLRVAVQRGRVGRNVALLVDTPATPKPQTTALSIQDTQALLAAAENTEYRQRWTIALLLGLRPGEALGLTWEDVNFSKGTIHVHQQLQHINKVGLILRPLVKTDAGNRTVIMPAFLTTLLQEHHAEQLRIRVEEGEDWRGWDFEGAPVALVFCKRDGTPIPPRLDYTNWGRLVAATGLTYTRPYTARHTAATIMLETIGDVAVVAHNLGHTDPAFTYKTYVHPLDDKKAQLAEKLNVFAPSA